jgi:hypothetical protein
MQRLALNYIPAQDRARPTILKSATSAITSASEREPCTISMDGSLLWIVSTRGDLLVKT